MLLFRPCTLSCIGWFELYLVIGVYFIREVLMCCINIFSDWTLTWEDIYSDVGTMSHVCMLPCVVLFDGLNYHWMLLFALRSQSCQDKDLIQ